MKINNALEFQDIRCSAYVNSLPYKSCSKSNMKQLHRQRDCK